jgi:hypothetical protein
VSAALRSTQVMAAPGGAGSDRATAIMQRHRLSRVVAQPRHVGARGVDDVEPLAAACESPFERVAAVPLFNTLC